MLSVVFFRSSLAVTENRGAKKSTAINVCSVRYRLHVKKWLKYTTKKSATRSFLFLLLVSSFRIVHLAIKKTHMSATLVNVVIILIVVGLVLWLINRFIPMDYKIKQILNIVVVIAVIIWLLKAFGLLSGIKV